MTHHHDHNRLAPKPLLIGCAAMVAVALTAAAAARVVGVASPIEALTLAEERSLAFSDRPDGGVVVEDAASGATIKEYPSGDGAFIRIAMRAVIAKRRQLDIGPETPFTLGRTANDQLLLIDEATGRRIALAAFGKDNHDAFAALLDTTGDAQ